MPNEILYVIEILKSFSHKAYVVGGSVRDFYLNKEPYDFDITTSARPEEIKSIFGSLVLSTVGEKFGTIVLRINSYDIEITTFRIESAYEENRKPKEVIFTNSLKEDLKRRDFTINAMAYNKDEGLIDLFNGKKDIEDKIIRTVGNPKDRINEDALRILRAIRLSGQLDFKIEENLYKEIIENRYLLEKLSKERIKSELDKVLMSDKPSIALSVMADTKVLEVILPSLYKTLGFNQHSPYHSKLLFEHILCVVDNVDKKLNLRYAALFHDIEKVNTLEIDKDGVGHFYGHDELGAKRAELVLKSYNTSKDDIKVVYALVKEHMKAHNEMTDKALRRQIRKVGKENILDLYSLMIADRICTIDGRDILFLEERKERIKELLCESTSQDKFLNITGKDIMSLGFDEGKIVGEILKYLEEKVLDDPSLNRKDLLIDLAVEKYRS